MPMTNNFPAPSSATLLQLPSDHKFFIFFMGSIDPSTKQSWCPDVRAALPYINAAFSSDEEAEVAFVEVGQKPEWRDPANIYRTNWNIRGVPTLVRYQLVDGEVKETGRILEDDMMNQKLQDFIRD